MNNTAEHERRSVLLRIITLAWLGFIVAAILSTIPIVIRQGLIWIDVVYGAHLVCGITVLYLNRRGFPRTAAMLFVYSFNLILLAGYAYSVYMRGGEVITSTAFIGVTYTLSLSILLGGILLGANSALQFAVFNNAALLMIFFVIAPDDAFASAGERSSYIGTLFSFQWLLALIAWLYERTLTGAFNRLTVAKSDLEQAVHNLEEAVAARTEELRMAKETAERANVAKSGFLSNVSHELRTPMNAIMGFAQLMERDTTLTSTQRENLSVISQSGEHLLELINDVLEMSRIEAGQIMLDENNFDLHHAIQRIDDMFRQRIENKNVEFQLNMAHDVPELVHADQRKLRQVLINLLSNAAKFTEHGYISMRIDVASRNDKQVSLCFAVEDTGIGISDDEKWRLFQSFSQTSSGIAQQSGTGLGLRISQEFVQLMGGEITVQSAPNVGSTFSFTVDMEVITSDALPTEQNEQRVIRLAPQQPVYRILIVEDKWANRAVLHKLLEPIGFSIREASDGKEAMAIAHHWRPHFIWMDMRMPVMDGYEATRRIKSHGKPEENDVIIVALTASAFEHEHQNILAAGCDDFVRKPFREADIFEMMRKHLGLQYIYEEAGPHHTPGNSVATPNRHLTTQHISTDLRNCLHEAATMADYDEALTCIEQIRAEDSTTARQLTSLLDNFDFEKIMLLTEK